MKRVLLTGASRGIGRAIARELLQAGHRLVLTGRDAEALAETAADSGQAQIMLADLRVRESLEALVQEAAERLGGLDVLINNAGVVSYESLERVQAASFEDQIAVDLQAPLFLSQAAAACMRSQGQGGAIVNVASTLGLRPAAGIGVYSAAKAALISLTRSLARELGPDGIRVSAVAPGVVETEMVHAARDGREAATELAELRALHPLGRFATAQEVAATVRYLMDATFVSGSVVAVDGGLSLVG